MKTVNLLEFLNSSETLHALDCATRNDVLVNFLDLLVEDEQLTQKINLGIIYYLEKRLNNYLVVDGLSRLLSLSLLLHAVCECYKKTSTKNENAIKTIRSKYLFTGNKTKLRLEEQEQKIYEKIINGDRLSGKEKANPMFKLLHSFWSQIKEENISASKIFKMLQKIYIRVVDIDDENAIDIYYTQNKDHKEINQLKLIGSYLKEQDLLNDWNKLLNIYKNSEVDVIKFFKDYFITKFYYKKFNENRLYETFVNYFITINQYISAKEFMNKLIFSANLYFQILNAHFDNIKIRDAFLNIKIHNGEDTYAYILNIFEDYIDGNISEATLLEIFSTIDEYLKNRIKTPNNVGFNELIEYLNAFITCK